MASTIADPRADYIASLPPITEDPSTYDGREDNDEYSRGGPLSAEELPDPNQNIEVPTEALARDDKGRFVKKDDEPAETPPATEATATPPAETAPPEPAKAVTIDDLLAQLTDDQRETYRFAEQLRSSENPLELLAKQLQGANLTDQFLQALGVPQEVVQEINDPAAKVGLTPDYEPSEFEKVLLPNIDKLAQFPQSVQAIAEPIATKIVQDQFNTITPYIDYANVDATIAVEQMTAIAEAIGIKLPDVNRKDVLGALSKDPNLSYAQAVRNAIGDKFKTAVEDYKQAVKARPDTPGSSDSRSFNPEDLPRDRPDGFGLVRGSDIFRSAFGSG